MMPSTMPRADILCSAVTSVLPSPWRQVPYDAPKRGYTVPPGPPPWPEHRSGYLAAVSNPRNSSKLVMHRSPREVIIGFIGTVVATDDATGGEFS